MLPRSVAAVAEPDDPALLRSPCPCSHLRLGRAGQPRAEPTETGPDPVPSVTAQRTIWSAILMIPRLEFPPADAVTVQ